MDRNALNAHQNRLFSEAASIMNQKGPDYSSDSDVLSNFKAGSRFNLSPLQTLGNYMFKHIDAIEEYIRTGTLKSEPIDSRILDCINYLTLLSALVHENDDLGAFTPAQESYSLPGQAANPALPTPTPTPTPTQNEPRCIACNVPPGHQHASWCQFGN